MSNRLPAYRQAQLEIKRYIEVNQLGYGDPLPPEATLAKELGISRPSLREGVKALESVGIVESRHGEGVFVNAFSFDAIIENLPYSMVADGKSLRDLLQVRYAIELGAVTLALDRMGAQDKRQLRVLAQEMLELAKQGKVFRDQDGAFHKTIYRCLNNDFLSRLIDLFWEMFRRLKYTEDHIPDRSALEASALEHLQIVDMIERRDELGLISALRIHFKAIFYALDEADLAAREPVKSSQALTPLGKLD